MSTDWMLLLAMGGFSVAALTITAVRLSLLRRSRELPPNAGLPLAVSLGALFLTLVIASGMFVVRQFEVQYQAHLREDYNSTLNAVYANVDLWIKLEYGKLQRIARYPRFSSQIGQLLDAIEAGAPETEELRDQATDTLQQVVSLEAINGYTVYSWDGVAVVSGLRFLVGNTFNSLVDGKPERFQRLRDGHSIFLPDLKAYGIQSTDPIMVRNESAVAYGALVVPLYHEGQIVAFLGRRVNPRDEFSRILLSGSFGTRGEAVAFNEAGTLTSVSRFESELYDMEMLAPFEQSVMSFQVNQAGDGADQQEQTVPTDVLSTEIRGLTRGENLTGFVDYKGGLVVGTWLWDSNLQLGFVVKQDADEAFAPIADVRRVILLVLISVVILTLGFAALVYSMSRRVNRELGDIRNDLEQRVSNRIDEMRVQEEGLQTILDRLPVVIYVKNAKTLRYELVNKASETLFGLNKDSVLGKYAKDIVSEDKLLAKIQQADDQVIRSGEIVSYEQTVTNRETGEQRHLIFEKIPMKNAQDEVSHILGISIDVTEQVQARDKMESLVHSLEETNYSLEFFKNTVEHAEYMVTWVDVESGNTEYMNAKARSFHGIEIEEDFREFEKKVRSQYGEQSDGGNTRVLQKQFEDEETVQAQLPDSTGELRDIEMTRQFFDKGSCKKVVFFGRDITEFKTLERELTTAREKAEQANQAKSDFLASMSHEIRTPLNAVLGLIGLVRKGNLEEQQREQLRIAEDSGRALLHIVNDILDFSKIQAKRLEIEDIAVNVHELIGDVAKTLSIKAEEKGLELILDLTELPQPVMRSDPVRLRQILNNLISNAIKFTDRGMVLVRASLLVEGGQQYLCCQVADTGIGIEKDNVDRLFDSFTQANASTTREYGGTGLGLAICKQLTELMGGSIEVKSKVGEGSTFQFTVAIKPSQKAFIDPRISAFKSLRVSLLEQHDKRRQILVELLQQWGVEVAVATSDETVLRRQLAMGDETPVQVVFIDSNRTLSAQGELVSAIRDSSKLSLRIILMTNPSDHVNTLNLNQIGLDGFFVKPAIPEDLISALSLVQTATNTPAERVSSEPSGKPPLKKMEVLFADDNTINQMIVVELLKEMGLSCHTVANGEEVLNFLKQPSQPKIHLVLMDCEMPIMDGYEATRRIRAGEAGKDKKDIPIVALTAHVLPELKQKRDEAGMTDYLAKPIDETQFRNLISSYMEVIEDDGLGDDSSPSQPAQMNRSEPAIVWPDGLETIDTADPPSFAKYTKAYLIALDEFSKQAPAQISALQAAVGEQNSSAVYALAHQVKGASANLGFKPLTETANALEAESSAQGEWHGGIEPAVSRFTVELERAESEASAVIGVNQQATSTDAVPLEKALDKVFRLLTSSQYVAIEDIELLEASMSHQDADLSALVESLRSFDYDDALDLIIDWRKKAQQVEH